MLKLGQFTKNKKIERNLLFVIAFCIAFYFVCHHYYQFNLVDYGYRKIDALKEFLTQDVDRSIEKLEDGLGKGENTYTVVDIADFTYRNHLNLDTFFELLYYFAPAILVVFLLSLVLVIDSVYFRIKYFILYVLYDETKDKTGEKIKNIVKNKIQEKNRILYLPAKVPILLVTMLVFDFFFTSGNPIIERTIQNMIGLIYIVILIYGLQLSTKFVRIRNSLMKNAYFLINLVLFFVIPQIYFIIGFTQSLFNINIIVYKQK